MPRLFVALDLPPELKAAARSLQSGLRNARWLDDAGLHLTLAFIGEVDGSAVERVEDALAEVEAEPIHVELHGLGCFPGRGAPRVLWTGAAPKAELADLASAVTRGLRRAGVTLKRRRFAPHVSLVRFRWPPPPIDLERYLAAHSLFRSPVCEVASFHLYSSILHPSGARHTIEATFPLERNGW
ncbi:MAG: RNA 2',3'-cyclic phosphodiesterase [Acidobacteriota bacterium]|nr:RNA 2',3'-cyclic phosphodiesterase [Acidobacteriota bacterium]